jgi:hypothetical protein
VHSVVVGWVPTSVATEIDYQRNSIEDRLVVNVRMCGNDHRKIGLERHIEALTRKLQTVEVRDVRVVVDQVSATGLAGWC